MMKYQFLPNLYCFPASLNGSTSSVTQEVKDNQQSANQFLYKTLFTQVGYKSAKEQISDCHKQS